MNEKLQKVMARAGTGSRRYNETLISAGRVTVNGIVALLGDRADPNRDVIVVDGKTLTLTDLVYIKLYKPKGVLSSTEDELEQNRLTVRELVPIEGHLYPVGRLDKQSEGLILLTNDGSLAHRLTHPRYGHGKVYEVVIRGTISSADLRSWENGVILDGSKTAPASLKIESSQRDHTRLIITLREGRKRQIRRIAAILGYEVTKLRRIQIGPIELGDLKPGEWRHLSSVELEGLRRFVGTGRAQKKSRGRG